MSSSFAANKGGCLNNPDIYSKYGDVIDASNCQINDNMLLKVLDLTRQYHPSTLILAGNNIGPAGAKLLARFAKVEWINLQSNHIGTEGALALAKSNIKYLSVNSNGIDKKGITALAEHGFLYLDVGDNNLDSEDVLLLLKSNPEAINLEGANINDEALNALIKNRSLKELNLSYSNVSEDDLDRITATKELDYLNISGLSLKSLRFLVGYNSLTQLYAADNKIGMYNLSNIFKLPRLQVLDLSSNFIDDSFIKNNLANLDRFMIMVNLNWNKLTDESIDILNKKADLINFVELYGNTFSEEGISRLDERYQNSLRRPYSAQGIAKSTPEVSNMLQFKKMMTSAKK